MQNYFSCCLLFSQQQYRKYFSSTHSFGLVRRQNKTESLLVFQPTKKIQTQKILQASKKSLVRFFQNSLIKLTRNHQTVLLYTHQPLPPIKVSFPSKQFLQNQLNQSPKQVDKNPTIHTTYHCEKTILNSSFALVQNNYFPISMKTEVFSYLKQAINLDIEVENYSLGDHAEVRIYRTDREQLEEIIQQKLLRQKNKNILTQGRNNFSQKPRSAEQKLLIPKSIVVAFIDHNFCTQFREDKLNRVQIMKQMQTNLDKTFGDFFDFYRGNRDFVRKKQKQQHFSQLKQDHFVLTLTPFLKQIDYMLENNRENIYRNNKIRFQIAQSAFIINFALRPLMNKY